MIAEQLRQDLLANDLANVSTPGYKADRVAQASFSQLLLANTATGEAVGSLALGTVIAEVRTDLSPQALRETGEPLDIGVEGEGFLAVQTSGGVRYTRGGHLVVDAEGRLVTAAGHALLDTAGNPISVEREAGVEIAADGQVTVGGKSVGQLALVSLTAARKEGDSLFTGTAGERPQGSAARQGYLEATGADAARTMVDMIASLRSFEASQRVIRTIDETLGRCVNSAGAVGGG